MSPNMKYEDAISNEWFYPNMKGWKNSCCDCGLVHVFEFRVAGGGRVQIRARLDNRATGQIRRHLSGIKEKK